jgi:alpha-tubulin suppressor-like RCC1 family protein
VFTWGQSTKDGQVCFLPSQVDLSDIASAPVVVTKVVCGGWHSALLLNTGLAYEWQLGEDLRPLGGEIATQSVREISAGNFHTIAITDNGLVYSCGRNNCMQLARPNVKGSDPMPGKVEGIPPLASPDSGCAFRASAGEFHTAVVADPGARFGAVRKLLAMVREYFRKLCILTKTYYGPIIGRYELHQPEPIAKRKRKSWSFSFGKRSPSGDGKEPLQQQQSAASSPVAGSRASVRLMPATVRGRSFSTAFN